MENTEASNAIVFNAVLEALSIKRQGGDGWRLVLVLPESESGEALKLSKLVREDRVVNVVVVDTDENN